MKYMRFRLAGLMLGVFVAILTDSNALASGSLRTVVLSDAYAPGLSGDVILSDFGVPILNRDGHTTFTAELSGTGVNNFNDSAILTERRGTGLAFVAVEGDSIPGGDTNSHYLNLGEPLFNNLGQTAFFSQISEDGYIDRGLFSERGGNGLALLARNGDKALDTGEEFFGFGEPVFNDDGQLAFLATLRGSGVSSTNDTGIFLADGNNEIKLLAREGDSAPDANSGVRFGGQFTFGDPVLSTGGQTAFWSRLTGVDSFASGIFGVFGGNDLTKILRTGDAAPGTDAETSVYRVSSPVINGGGQVAFLTTLTSGAVVFYRYVGDSGLTVVVRTGDAVPGTDAGVTFRSFGPPVLNGTGKTAFVGHLAGADGNAENGTGIFREDQDGGLVLVARDGEAAPGFPEGINFGGRIAFGNPMLNRNGQIAFLGFLGGERGIFAEDTNGILRLIAATGQLLDVSDDPMDPDFRTILSLRIITGSGNEDGRRSAFNDIGQLAFYASFTDGTSGVFVSNLVAIPEPKTVFIAILAFVGTLLVWSQPHHSPSLPAPNRALSRQR